MGSPPYRLDVSPRCRIVREYLIDSSTFTQARAVFGHQLFIKQFIILVVAGRLAMEAAGRFAMEVAGRFAKGNNGKNEPRLN